MEGLEKLFIVCPRVMNTVVAMNAAPSSSAGFTASIASHGRVRLLVVE